MRSYIGVEHRSLSLDPDWVERFINVSDLRYDVSFQSTASDGRSHSDSLLMGALRWGYSPRETRGLRTRYTATRFRNNCWEVAVEDSRLAEDMAMHARRSRSALGPMAAEAVRDEMLAALGKVLLSEKMFNANRINLITYFSAQEMIKNLSIVAYAINALGSESGVNPAFLLAWLAGNFAYANVFNTLIAVIIRKHSMGIELGGLVPSYNEPYVKHSIPEMFLPTIPVDRLARGWFFLKRHGREMIKAET